MNYMYFIFYVIFAVSGSTLLKYGALEGLKSLFIVPILNLSVSLVTFIGFICYGLSFVFYTVLLSKFELSIVSPITVGLVYILLMLTAFLFFKEQITVYKILGSTLILLGVILIILKK